MLHVLCVCGCLQQQVEGLANRKAELQAEDAKPQVGPEDQRADLLARIKADNEAVEVATQQAKQATEAIRQLERQAGSAPIRYSSDVRGKRSYHLTSHKRECKSSSASLHTIKLLARRCC